MSGLRGVTVHVLRKSSANIQWDVIPGAIGPCVFVMYRILPYHMTHVLKEDVQNIVPVKMNSCHLSCKQF